MSLTHFSSPDPAKPAIIIAESGETVRYGELDETADRIAQLFRRAGLKRGDVVAILMENNRRFIELCCAAQRSGLYYCCISMQLAQAEIRHILSDSNARLVITSTARAELARSASQGLDIDRWIVGDAEGFQPLDPLLGTAPAGPLPDGSEGSDLLYSSGTTGKPKGVKVPLDAGENSVLNQLARVNRNAYRFSADTVYLSPGPLYHAAPLRWLMVTLRLGGTAVVMGKFDAELALSLIGRYRATHSQWVPTMFIRMLRLPKEVRERADISSLQYAVHAAAPCPPEVKQQMIEWWGPIIWEYYAGTESNGATVISSAEWLEHRGSVGRAVLGKVHIVSEDGKELPPGEIGLVYFSGGPSFEYMNDPEKTASVRNREGWTTLGDIGSLDEDGYLYLTDRQSNMIISGGVNIYPQETENVLITHPQVLDVAVLGVPHEEFGEEVRAYVRLAPGARPDRRTASDLIAFCRARIAALKTPRSIAFVDSLPRHANGKLVKRMLRGSDSEVGAVLFTAAELKEDHSSMKGNHG